MNRVCCFVLFGSLHLNRCAVGKQSKIKYTSSFRQLFFFSRIVYLFTSRAHTALGEPHNKHNHEAAKYHQTHTQSYQQEGIVSKPDEKQTQQSDT